MAAALEPLRRAWCEDHSKFPAELLPRLDRFLERFLTELRDAAATTEADPGKALVRELARALLDQGGASVAFGLWEGFRGEVLERLLPHCAGDAKLLARLLAAFDQVQLELLEESRAADEPHAAALDLPFFVATLDLGGITRSINELGTRLMGASRAEVIGHALWDAPCWASRPQFQERLRDAMGRASGGEIQRFDVEVLGEASAQGLKTWLELAVQGLYEPRGQLLGYSVSGLDVSRRIRSEQHLREARLGLLQSEQRLKIATRSAQIGIFSFDPHSRLFSLSPLSCSILGLPSREQHTLDEVLRCLVPEEQSRFRADMGLLLEEPKPTSLSTQWRLRSAEGQIRHVLSTAQKVFEDGAEGRRVRIIGTHMDITERVQLEQALRFAKDAADQANHSKSAFLTNMSHEIRSPLGTIMGLIGLLRENGLSREEQEEYLAIIDRNSQHLLSIIDDILDLAKVEANKVTAEQLEFSLSEFLEEFTAMMTIRAQQNGNSFSCGALSLLPERIISDPTRVRQILVNVVGNALKFTSRGQVSLTVAYEDGLLSFTVQDSGRGISPEQAALLFRPFAQADSETTRKFGGTGLGLVLTKKLAQLLGGDFELLHSEMGKGSTFQATIRPERPQASPLIELRGSRRPLKKPALAPSASLSGLEVLLVEDSLDNQLIIEKMVRHAGGQIEMATDGLEGLEKALARFYDVILMDIQMPRMDGHEAVRRLRSRGYKGPVVALTAHAMKNERERTLASGFSHFLTKPVDRRRLIALLGSLHQAPTYPRPPAQH